MRSTSLMLFAALAACTRAPLGGPVDAPPDAGPADLAPYPPIAVGPNGVDLTIGPIALAPNTELTRCIVVALDSTTPLDIIELSATLAPGSHHLVLYLTDDAVDPNPTNCIPFEGATTGTQPIFIAESATTTLRLPAGVSWRLAPGQRFKLEAHYINASLQPLTGVGTFHLTAGDPAMSYQPAGIMFCGSVSELMWNGVPASASDYALGPGFYAGTPTTSLTTRKVFALTTHQHHLGSDVKIWKASGLADPGALLFDNPDWSAPPLLAFDDAHLLTFAPGEGLKWQCRYDALDAVPPPTGTTYFGLGALTSEMCFIWAYYYPAADHFISQECWQ